MRVICIIAICAMLLIGCTSQDKNLELYKLLPSSEGLVWRYDGFVEYDHVMKLDKIEGVSGGKQYLISGEVGDPSGGESERNFALSITYTIKNGVWVQTKQEEAMLDSEFDKIEILRGPVKKGQSWTQTQTDKAGTQMTLLCTIEEVKAESGLQVVRVKYQDQSSPYYEMREIKQGVGIVSFEKLWISSEGNFEIGYSLFRTE